jgi:hypothetical protein
LRPQLTRIDFLQKSGKEEILTFNPIICTSFPYIGRKFFDLCNISNDKI